MWMLEVYIQNWGLWNLKYRISVALVNSEGMNEKLLEKKYRAMNIFNEERTRRDVKWYSNLREGKEVLIKLLSWLFI